MKYTVVIGERHTNGCNSHVAFEDQNIVAAIGRALLAAVGEKDAPIILTAIREYVEREAKQK